MNLIQKPEVQRRLQRGFNMKEPTPAPTLAPEIVPVAVVSDLTAPENAFELVRPCTASFGITSAALEFPTLALFCPQDSGTLIDLEFFIAHTATGQIISVALDATFDPALFTVIGTRGFRDLRLSPGNAELPVGQVLQDSSAVLLGALERFTVRTSAAPSIPIPWNVVLPPGSAIIWQGSLAASILQIGAVWRERALLG